MRRTALLSAAVVSLVGGSLAYAQSEKPKSPQGTPPVVGKQDLKKGMPFCHKASEIIGSKVKNMQGEDLGNVEELVIEPNTGSIDYAVVSFGGFLGMGEKLFAVPFSLLKAPEVQDDTKWAHFTMNVDKARLEKAPGFEKSNWPDIAAPTWSEEIDRYYGTTRARNVRHTGDDLESPKKDPSKTDSAKAIDSNKEYRLCKASELIGKDVHNTSKDELGEINELVLDPRRSRVNYFVMKSGGFLGMGEKLFAIPWEAMKFDRKEKKDELVLNVAKERFDKAPEYKDQDWNRMNDPSWIEEMYGYYKVQPYWRTGGTGSGMPIDR